MKYISWSLPFPDSSLAMSLVSVESAWARTLSSLLLGWWSSYNCYDPFGLVLQTSATCSFTFPLLIPGHTGDEKTFVFLEGILWLSVLLLLNSDQLWVFSSVKINSYVSLLTSPFPAYSISIYFDPQSPGKQKNSFTDISGYWVGFYVQYLYHHKLSYTMLTTAISCFCWEVCYDTMNRYMYF